MTRWLLTGLVIIIVTGGLVSHAQANAGQTHFSRQIGDKDVTYSYGWLTPEGTTRNLSFSLNRSELAQAPAAQANYSARMAQRYVYVEVMKAARNIDPKQARIAVEQKNEGIEIRVSSTSAQRNEDITRQLADKQDDAFDAYLHDHYFTRYQTVYNESAIKPDHTRFIDEYIKALVPLSQAIYEQVTVRSDARQYFSVMLGLIQTIPYDALEDRAEHNGSGFLTPAQVLAQNKGDCDSKSVLTAALARAFLPDVPMALILLPEHALLGVALAPKAGEQTLQYGDTEYILFEPTGPAQLPFGEIAEQSRVAIANQQFTVEEIKVSQ
ncbi:hypothetical protein [Salinimonas lutimaris]|uniref:hypothetical protein n=1 Tax=Salinimonas lutimaris TaxID=914153 RepID=UPI0010BF91D3|nr:hypothetical protein [Salinimonas lutimaris]